MSDTADKVVAAWRSMLPVRKSAAVAEERAIAEAVIRSIVDAVEEHVEKTMPLVQSMMRTTAAIAYPVTYPSEWRAWRGDDPIRPKGYDDGRQRGHEQE